MGYQKKDTKSCLYVISNEIKNKTNHSSYLLYGEEDYLKYQNYRNLLAYVGDPNDTMNVTWFDDGKEELGKIIDLAQTLPFFATKRVIVIRNSGYFSRSNDELADYLKHVPESTVLIFVEAVVDKRNKSYKAIAKEGLAVEYVRQSSDMLAAWVKQKIRAEDKQVLTSTLVYFLGKTGSDMEIIEKELEKLITYCWKRKEITIKDVEAVCATRVEDQVFKMIDEISVGNGKKAWEMYYDLLALKVPPIKILSLINRHMQLIYHVMLGRKQGKSASEMGAGFGAQGFVVKRAIEQSRHYTLREAWKILEQGVEIDHSIKSGHLEAQMGVELYIASFFEKAGC